MSFSLEHPFYLLNLTMTLVMIVKENNDVTGVLTIKDAGKYYVHKFSMS